MAAGLDPFPDARGAAARAFEESAPFPVRREEGLNAFPYPVAREGTLNERA